LLSVEKRKHHAIIAQDLNKLRELLDTSQQILSEIESAEKTRMRLTRKIGGGDCSLPEVLDIDLSRKKSHKHFNQHKAAGGGISDEPGIQEDDQPETITAYRARRIPRALKEKILYSARQLRCLMDELKQINRKNQELLQSSLEVLEFSVGLYSGTGSGGKTYSEAGEENKTSRDQTSLVFNLKI
ncbi:MAG: hypothetical protein ACOC7U_10520, partial [Spirochaetota bacterium]